MNNNNYNRLNLKELRQKRKSIIVSSKEALKDVTPINWNKEVLAGNKKVIISK